VTAIRSVDALRDGDPKPLRFKVGDRVTCARGFAIGSTGRIDRRAPAPADWVVRFDEPVTLSSGTVMAEGRFDDDELAAFTVPESARPVSDARRLVSRLRLRRAAAWLVVGLWLAMATVMVLAAHLGQATALGTLTAALCGLSAGVSVALVLRGGRD
jgi:hypothetical protein